MSCSQKEITGFLTRFGSSNVLTALFFDLFEGKNDFDYILELPIILPKDQSGIKNKYGITLPEEISTIRGLRQTLFDMDDIPRDKMIKLLSDFIGTAHKKMSEKSDIEFDYMTREGTVKVTFNNNLGMNFYQLEQMKERKSLTSELTKILSKSQTEGQSKKYSYEDVESFNRSTIDETIKNNKEFLSREVLSELLALPTMNSQ